MVAFGKKQDIMTPVLQPAAATETRETELQMRRPA
jgi:hypothetical protein